MKPQEIFKQFYFRYMKKGKKLTWQHSLSQCVVRANFPLVGVLCGCVRYGVLDCARPQGKKELHLSLYQAMVLLLFNKADEMGYKDIEEATGFGKRFQKRMSGGRHRATNALPFHPLLRFMQIPMKCSAL